MANGSLIIDGGKKVALNRIYKDTPDYNEPNKIKTGINNGTPSMSSTDLDTPIPITGTESVDDCETADWSDNADMTSSLNSTTFKEGSNALDLTKDGTASDTASTSKTTTSIDFTNKELSLWLYIVDATALGKLTTTDCITIRFGNDSSNYFQYTRDTADLSTGWNYINFTSLTADSETGTVNLATCDYSYIAIKADASGTVWSAGDFIMDDWKVASSGDFFESILTSYPTFDETNHEVELRFELDTTEANGYPINSVAVFNDDTTKVMCSEDTFDEESKSDTDEFIFVIKDRIE